MEHLTHPAMTPVDLINADDDSTLWLGRLHFEPSDPMAVTLEINTRSQGTIPWSFARDLLANGIFEPSGAGAVQVWPCLAADVQGRLDNRIGPRRLLGRAFLSSPLQINQPCADCARRIA